MSTTTERTADIVARNSDDRSELLRRALIKLKAARAEVAEAKRLRNEPVAVVGIGCRFPGGAAGVEAFWDLLIEGRSGVREVPADRWDSDEFFAADPEVPGRTYSRHGGFIEGVRCFDAGLFGIPPREAVSIDPQHRLVLEVAWEALEHAGIAPDSLRGTSTGVFVGIGGSDYERLNLAGADLSALDGYAATGSPVNFAANRLSYALGLEGPSLAVDTACSSSLVALHLAGQALRNGECDTALVGGVNLLLSPGTMVALSKGRMLSLEGLCKTFDATADGYVRGEGCGVVVIQRLSTALREGHETLAIITGSAVNQDGKSSGLTVPRASAQQDVIRRALAVAGLRPGDVGYVEAHGTGTALGDPIEVRSLAGVLGQDRDTHHPLMLGSVKTNIGHLEAAAGIAGFIKAVLMVERGAVPAHLNLSRLNPLVAWNELPITVPTAMTRWPERPRIAGVSSFGFGGTNAHVVLQSPPEISPAEHHTQAPGPVLVKVAAKGTAALQACAARLASFVRDTRDEMNLAALAWSAGAGRAELSDRAAVVATSPLELAEGLRAIANARPGPGVVPRHRAAHSPPKVAFVVPAQESRIAGALHGLYGHLPALTDTIDELATVLGPTSQPPLSVLLCPAPGSAAALTGTAIISPALYALAVSLGAWWHSVGVRPDIVIGDSAGGYAAAALAGVFPITDGARLITHHGSPEPLATMLGGLEPRPPDVDLVLDASATVVGAEVATAGYWLRRARERVQLPDLLRTALDRDVRFLVELGPGGTLPDLTSAGGASGVVCLPSVTPGTGSRRQPLESLARIWAEGLDIDWTRVNGPRPAHLPRLPTYPFQRTVHWLPTAGPAAAAAHDSTAHDGMGMRPRIVETATGDTIGEIELSPRLLPFLTEHQVHGRLVVAGVIFLELILRCAAKTFDGPVRVDNLSISRPLVLAPDDTVTVQVVISQPEPGRARARVYSKDPVAGWRAHLDTFIAAAGPPAGPAAASPGGTAVAEARSRCTEVIGEREFYGQAWHPSFQLGASFQLVKAAMRGPRLAVGTLVQPAANAAAVSAGVRPELLLLDACVQLVAVAAYSGTAGWETRPVHLGTGCEQMVLHRPVPPGGLECAAVLRDSTGGPVIGDLQLVGSDGQLVAELTGASFRPVTPEMLTRLIAERAAASGGRSRRAGVTPPEGAWLRGADGPERHRAVLAYLVRSLARIMGSAPEEIDPDVPVTELVDSLMLAELKSDADRDLGVTIPMETIFQDGRLTTLAAWVAAEIPVRAPVPTASARPAAKTARPATSRRPGGRLTAMTVAEMTRRAELEPSIAATGDPEPEGVAPEATLLTGATGYVGAFLLAELLNRRRGDVLCLVRADDPAHAIRRILANLELYGIDPGPHRNRIVPVAGDLAKPLLGLERGAFADLHLRVGQVVHCGGAVKWTYPYSGLEGANVGGTREILRLGTVGAPRPVHFISTVGVFSSTDHTADRVRETDDLRASGSLAVGYAQTKWVAERMVRTAHERGVPVTIHRINTGGHSTTGAFNRSDYLTMMLTGCIDTGIAPEQVAMPVQPAPIDYVASAVVELSMRPELNGRTFHLVNDRPMTWSQLLDSVVEFGYRLERLPFSEWKERIVSRQPGARALLGLTPFLTDTVDHVRLPLSDSTDTRSALHGSGLSCPPLDTALVHTYLRGFISAGFVDPPVNHEEITDDDHDPA